ncbi:MAG: WS/DGAT/MGAT family O-acyltransferase [Oceanococcus sp.]
MIKKLNATDAFFLQVEKPESPMHVANLSRFKLAKGKSKQDILRLVEQMRAHAVQHAPFNRRLIKSGLGFAWETDGDIDLDFHVRYSALPQPGGERELAVLISRLHSIPLDRTRPMWECHIIEGFADGSFALYVKMHHALIDGVAGARLLQRAMGEKPSTDPVRPFWAIEPTKRESSLVAETAAIAQAVRAASDQLGSLPKVFKSLIKLARSKNNKDLPNLVAPYSAPECVLNGPIGQQRRVSTQDFKLKEIKALAKAADATLNDVVMTLCAGALRSYLAELGELPRTTLTAQVPVSIRPEGQEEGNAISSILADLATDEADTVQRLRRIQASMNDSKTLLGRMSKTELANYSTMLMAPFAIGQMMGIGNRRRKPMYNVVISNVPGPRQRLYMGDAELVSSHPVSLVFQGQALNITIFSYAETLSIVYTACRKSLPHLQHIVAHADQALADLHEAFD